MRKFLTGILWVISFNAFSQQPIFFSDGFGKLYSCNLSNCSVRYIGETGAAPSTFTDIAFTPDGRLWGIKAGALYLIDTTTANTTFIGNLGVDGASLVDLNDSTLLIESYNKLYGINVNNGSSYYIDTIGYSADGDLTWYDDALYMVTAVIAPGNRGIVKLELNAANTAIVNITLLGDSIPESYAAVSTFSCGYNVLVDFSNSSTGNVYKICPLDGSYTILCPNLLGDGAAAGAAAIRLPTQNPQPTSCAEVLQPPHVTHNPMICSGETYTRPNGAFVSTAGTYIDTVQSINGCDSIITTNLTVNSIYQLSQSAVICDNDFYTLPNGINVNTTGTYIDTLQNINGCDSIITTQLTANPNYQMAIFDTICSSQSYTLPSGTTVNTTGIYADTFQTISGCDSIIIVHLTAKQLQQSTQNIVICNNEAYTLPNGQTINVSGVYVDTLQFISGCDSAIITTNLTATSLYQSSQSAVICGDEPYTLPNGITTITSGTYIDTIQTVNGCDSIITTTLNENPTFQITIFDTICPNQIYTRPNGVIVNTTNVFIDTLQSVYGCDSIITTDLTVFPSCDFYIPNAFSPNSDVNNDYFSLFFTRKSFVKQLFVKIFNRWGEKVFDSNDVIFRWDGRYKGNYVPSGVYVYELQIVFLNNKTEKLKGSITVLR